jgi:hypothetical protein
MNATTDPILAYRGELYKAATRRRTARKRRQVIVAAMAVAAVVFAGLSIAAVAATGWFQASPAPPPVVSDFRAYTPQLGFHPEPGKAVFVAQDGEFKLYATTDREGTYCLVADLPWRHPTAGDGGVCVPKRDASEPLTASVIGASQTRLAVAGRVQDARARAVEFANPDGDMVQVPLGAGGFYIAAVRTDMCPASDWAPDFSALAGDGQTLLTARILLIRVDPMGCGGPTIPHGPEVRRGPHLGKGRY